MAKKPKKDEATKDKVQFTFRLPPYLADAWRRRMRSQPFKITYQAYLNKLVEDDLLQNGCIAPDDLQAAKEAAEADE